MIKSFLHLVSQQRKSSRYPWKRLIIMACLLLLFAIAATRAMAEEMDFLSVSVTQSAPSDPWEKAMADLSGDGQVDLIIGGPTGPLKMYVYPDWSEVTITGSGSYDSACGIAAADIDNDGDNDVIMGGIVWYENPLPSGNPLDGFWTSHSVASHRAHDIKVHDLDDDGLKDIIARGQGGSGSQVYIFKQNDPDHWTQRTLPAFSGEGLDLGDVDDDGDMDIVIAGYWYENDTLIVGGAWERHAYAASFDAVAVVRCGDINGDGRTDVVLSASESSHRVSWFESPPDPGGTLWTENTVIDDMVRTHGLVVADYDNDGDNDIAASEFDGDGRLMLFHNLNGLGTSWYHQVLGSQSLHNIQTADVGSDGDWDIFGAYCWGSPAAYLWENQLEPGAVYPLDDWTYVTIDDSRDARHFGLAMGEGSHDGFLDIASGSWFYINPGGQMTQAWERITFPVAADANLMLDVDGDNLVDIIAQDLPLLYWLEADNEDATAFTARVVADQIPATSHGNSQGYALGQVIPGGRQEIVLSSGNGVYFVQIPQNPVTDTWPVVNITTQPPEEGIALGDIDGDGDDDLVAFLGTPETRVAWWDNPGDGSGNWDFVEVGTTLGLPGDRIEIADLNQDTRPDIIITETNNSTSGSALNWFQAPEDPRGGVWTRITVDDDLGALNSLDVGDMDNDGDTDIITGGHRGLKRVVIWENDGMGGFSSHVVDQGKESHLGARIADMDGDDDLDILSICWDDYPFLHLWRNNAVDTTSDVDEDPPMIAAAAAYGDPYEVRVTFNEPLEDQTAQNAANYSISGNIEVYQAQLSSDGRTVVLTTSGLSETTVYTLVVNHIQDLAGNVIVPNSQVLFTYNTIIVPQGLIAYWPFDEGSGDSAADLTGNGHDGTISGAVWSAGKFGDALVFGGGAHVAVEPFDIPADPDGDSGLSIALWMKAESFAVHDARLIAKSTGTAEQDHYWMVSTINSGGIKLRFRLKTDGETTTLIADSGTLTTNQWTHVAATYDGNSMRIFKDGEAVGSVSKTGSIDTNDAVAINIGRNPDGYGAFDGIIDEVRVYNRVLDENEIDALISGTAVMYGDVDGDGDTDGADLSLLVLEYGTCTSGETCACDLDHDGQVDAADLALFSQTFGR